MKKFSFLLVGAVALMLFTACSSSEDDSSESKEYKEDQKAADDATFSSHDDGISISGDTIFVSFSADGGEVTIDVDCDVSWSVRYNAISTSLSYTYTSNSVTIKARQNSTTMESTGTIYLRTVKSGITFATIVITQEAPEAYLILGDEELFLSSVGNDVKVNVETNCYSWKCESDADWLTAEASTSAGYMTISYTKNETGAEREGCVTVYGYEWPSTHGETAMVAELKVTQSSENLDAFILEYTLTSNNQTIELPLYDAKNLTIDWDDGEVTTFTSYSNSIVPTHTYSTPGKYQVSINGVVEHIYNYNNNSKSYLTAVVKWGNTGLTSMEDAFYECENLTSIPENTRNAFANVTTFYRAFRGCTLLELLPANIFSGCTFAKNFNYAFYNCTSLQSLPENLFSGCSSATDFNYAFYNCTSLQSLPENLFSGCSSATDFDYAFEGCTSLKSIPANLFAGCASATFFNYTFKGCTSLTTLSGRMFSSCSSATNFNYAFEGCTSLASITGSLFADCTSATSFNSTFEGCTSLKSISTNLFAGCTSATSFDSTFKGCTSLTTVTENLFSDCSSATDFSYAFYSCTNLTNAPSFEGLSSVTSFRCVFYDCSSLTWITGNIFAGCTSVTTFANAFYNCFSLKSISWSLFDDCSLVSSFRSTFYGCSSVTCESPYIELTVNGSKVKAHIYERENYAVDMRWTIPTDYANCFTDSQFSDYESIPSNWK